ncbi:MAG: hypothetical protein QOD86_2896, partial [Miltoncostaeaceae bacterium]|nr:hypothetical protein [Miltoncostaeaceae bacterium]
VALLRLLGPDGLTTLQRRLRAPDRDRDGREGVLAAVPAPAPLHMAPSLAAYPFLGAREKASAARLLLALGRLSEDELAALDRRSFADVLREGGQSERAIDRFWDLIVLPTCNDRSERVSGALAAFVFREGFLRTAGGSAIGYARVGLTRLVDPAARDFLAARGGRVLSGRAVAAAGPGEVRLADGTVLPADGVVLALPPRRTREVAPAALPEDPDLGVSPIVNVHVWYDRPVMERPFTAVLDSPAQWVFDRTAMAGGGEGSHLAVSISGAHEEATVPRGELAERLIAELAHVFPAARRARVLASAVVKEPEATFAASPGSGSRRPGPATPLPSVAIAGAWTDTGWPATMEGAVRSGIRAARVVLGEPPKGPPGGSA